MALKLEPGELSVRLHNGRDLKDCDWFGEQDPYVILKCGKVKYRSNVHKNGGKNPVWGQTFVFKVEQETELECEVWDEDVGKNDDCIGKGKLELVTVRHSPQLQQDIEVPLFRRISRRQQGFIRLTLSFRPSRKPADDGQPGSFTGAAGLTAGASGAVIGVKSEQHQPLAAGLVPAGGLPDNVAKYEPTCGLIQPLPHQLLPCHQGSNSFNSVATTTTTTASAYTSLATVSNPPAEPAPLAAQPQAPAPPPHFLTSLPSSQGSFSHAAPVSQYAAAEHPWPAATPTSAAPPYGQPYPANSSVPGYGYPTSAPPQAGPAPTQPYPQHPYSSDAAQYSSGYPPAPQYASPAYSGQYPPQQLPPQAPHAGAYGAPPYAAPAPYGAPPQYIAAPYTAPPPVPGYPGYTGYAH